jgi:hypothetical protein
VPPHAVALPTRVSWCVFVMCTYPQALCPCGTQPARRPAAGLPPPYARRPGLCAASFDLQAAVEAVYGAGADAASVRLWRRKLVRHWDSERPPYYGSWSRWVDNGARMHAHTRCLPTNYPPTHTHTHKHTCTHARTRKRAGACKQTCVEALLSCSECLSLRRKCHAHNCLRIKPR